MVTGLVIIMMLMLEYINVSSQGRWATRLRSSSFGQVLLGALLGVFPGCVGGFAAVSLYSHKMLSFGALVAMLIASSGDESFVMLAMFPGKALLLFAALLAVGIVSGVTIDRLRRKPSRDEELCCEGYNVHDEDIHEHQSHHKGRSISNLLHFDWRRIVILAGILLFVAGLVFGLFEHSHGEAAAEEHHGHFNLFDEYWINLIFAVISVFAIWFTAVSDSHFVKEHLWNHIVRRHVPSVFLWTFGALLAIELGLHYLNLESWTSDNIPLMILLAVLIGLIPDSGPHLIFVTMFAGGMVPFSVLLASSISQDGHAALPLLAETKSGFVKAKAINALIAAIVGYGVYFLGA